MDGLSVVYPLLQPQHFQACRPHVALCMFCYCFYISSLSHLLPLNCNPKQGFNGLVSPIGIPTRARGELRW